MASPVIPSRLWTHLICSYCGHDLRQTATGAECPACGLAYGCAASGALDLRLQREKNYPLDITLGTPLLPEGGFHFAPLTMSPAPQVDFSAVAVPRHLTTRILSYFPKAKAGDSMMLDLGCGEGIHRQVCEHAGFEWVGLDYEAEGAQMLGDAHSLPFHDGTFEFVLCVTVLQYTRYPLIAMREAYRVLKPGGRLVGTVAFLEPSHGRSFHHHTDLGTFNALQQAGFRVDVVAPSAEWTVLRALANMGLFYGLPKPVSEAIVWPLQMMHQLWWRAGGLVTRRDLRDVRIRNFTGSFTFVGSKPEATSA